MRFFIYFYLLFFSFNSCTQKEKLFKKLKSNGTGIEFSNILSDNENFNLIEYLYFYNGAGVATGDINNDGLIDIYFSSNQGSNKLYLNQGDFQFKDITDYSGTGSLGEWKTGVTIVDVNGDGLLDIYQCRLGGYKNISGKNELFINNGDLTFSEKADEFGLDFEGFSTHSAFFDYDSDGDLDMYLLNHSVHTERSYGSSDLRYNKSEKSGDKLFRNDLSISNKFIDVSDESGILGSNIGYGLGISISDINKDGCDDIYISNDFRENDYLYINNCDGTFREKLESSINYTSRFSMGNDISDINNDLLPDIMVLDMLPEDEKVLKSSAGEDSYEIYKMKLDFGFNKQFTKNTLQLNNGNNTFSEISQMLGVHATDWSWSTLIEDFDLDGNNDIFITNGIVKRPNDMDYISFLSNEKLTDGLIQNPNLENKDLVRQMPDGRVSNYAFKNNSNLKFTDVSKDWGLDFFGFSNGATYDDLDNDGDQDLIVNNINDKSIIYKNTVSNNEGLNFLKINFNGSQSNKFGIGAKVTIWYKDKSAYKENFINKGFLSSKSSGLIFGVSESLVVDSLMVIWPNKKTQTLYSLDANNTIILNEKDALSDYKIIDFSTQFFTDVNHKNLIQYTHMENDFNDFNRERLIPYMLSKEGPALASGDVDNDGDLDLFVGSPSFQKSKIFLSNDQKFESSTNIDIENDSISEDVDALFFDIDNDNDLDLYVVSAGNEFSENSKSLRDRLYINHNGNFYKKDTLSQIVQNNSVVINYDYNQDGYEDLFIGGRAVPQKYGESPKSYLLKNMKNGDFEIDTIFNDIGMITDAKWEDMDGDGLKDLITCGDWNSINIYYNKGNSFRKDKNFIGNQIFGWWFSLETSDINNDGKMDIIAGNVGINNKLKPTKIDPVKMYINDFDQNGIFEHVLTYSKNKKEYPISNKDELTKELNYLKRDFFYYKDFAGLDINDIFPRDILENSKLLYANNFSSLCFINQGESFDIVELPLYSQISSIRDIQILDFNKDEKKDLLLVGNNSSVSTYFGSFESSYGVLLEGIGDGTFKYVKQNESGLNLRGDITKVLPLDKNKSKFVFGINDRKISVFSLNNEN